MPIVQRHPAAVESAPERPHRSSSAGTSFASMFSAASEAAETGYTTVQLQADDSSHGVGVAPEPGAAPKVATADLSVQREGETAPPSSTPAPSAAPSAAPAGAAPAGADLDEMARRLFEPLSARLRAEFWLDRERAGLMTMRGPNCGGRHGGSRGDLAFAICFTVEWRPRPGGWTSARASAARSSSAAWGRQQWLSEAAARIRTTSAPRRSEGQHQAHRMVGRVREWCSDAECRDHRAGL
jgi:hypothetical protein